MNHPKIPSHLGAWLHCAGPRRHETGPTESAQHQTQGLPVNYPRTVEQQQLQEESPGHTEQPENASPRNELYKKPDHPSMHRRTSRMGDTRNDHRARLYNNQLDKKLCSR